MKKGRLFVISLGGSLIVPDQIDAKYLKSFCSLILKLREKGNKFIVVTGGGKIARQYQAVLRQFNNQSSASLDWIGIYVTRLNARLVQLSLGKQAYREIVKNPFKKLNAGGKIIIASGYKPGRSTDYVSTALAKLYQADTVINLSNIDYVYTKDPRKHKDAKKIAKTSWNEFIKIVGTKWDPGKNVPFDPTAAKFAKENKLKVIICNGKKLKNLENILEEKNFIGTIIS